MIGGRQVSETLRRVAGTPARVVLSVALAAGLALALAHHAVEDQLVLAWPSEEWYLDHLFRTRANDRAPRGEEILLIHFNDETFRALNTPYIKFTPHFIRLVELLRQGEPKVIGMDIGFASFAESGEHEAFLATCQQRNDVVFTSEIQAGRAVPLLERPVVAMIHKASPPVGFANLHLGDPAFVSQVNRGNVVRLVPVYRPGARAPWSFPVELARRARKLKPDQLIADDRVIKVGDRAVPLENGMLRVDYRGWRYFDSLPAENFLSGKLPPRIVKGRVVLVGSDYHGLGDFHRTPFGEQNGVRVQAAATHTLLGGQPLRSMPAAVSRGIVVVVAVLVGLAFARLSRAAAVACTLALMAAVHAATLAAFQQGIWVPSFFALAAAPFTGVLLWGLDFMRQPEVRVQNVIRGAAPGSAGRSRVPDATMPGGPGSSAAGGGDLVLRIAREVVAARYGHAELLGRGGMGVVLRAYDPERQQHVAVKILSPLLADRPQLVSRFMREIKALQQLEHPGVVRILDVGEGGSNPYYSMELVDGADLKGVMREGPFPLERARHVFGQLLEVLAHIHAHGIIHRDIKPDNVLLMPDDRVKLLDFGLAHVPEGTTLTQAGEVMGTLRYMSPEQMEGAEVTASSDVFSIALVIFEALTGKTPFPEIGRVLHHSGTITSVNMLRPDVPVAVAELLMHAVSPAPHLRPATCAEMAEAWRVAWS